MKNNYKTKYPLIILFVFQFSSLFLNGQISFQHVYPSSKNQSGEDVVPTSDGGYLIAGNTETSLVNDIDILISKTDNLGDTLWTKSYGGSRPDYPNCILPVSGGNFLIVGYSQSFGGGDQDIYLLKINSSGDTLWTKTYGGYGNEEGKEIVATSDGNFVIVGGSNSVSLADNNMELLKIDPSGIVLWTKYYGGPNYESARSVKLCLDGGFILAGKTGLSDTSIASVFLVKTDISGNVIWIKTFGGPDSYEGKSVLANADTTYTLCLDDSSAATNLDIRIMNISATGTINWNKIYGGTDKDICKMIKSTSDGGYIVAGISRSFGWVNPDMWLLKLNTTGDTLWTRHYGGTGHEHCYAARQTPDGGYIAVGQSRSYSSNIEMMLVKLDSVGKILPLSVNELASNNLTFNIYPNPTDGISNMDLNDIIKPGSIFMVSNSLGQIMFSEIIDQSGTTKNKIIDLKDKKPGIYFVTIQSTNKTTTKKLVLN